MANPEKIKATERENRAWAIWAFLGSDLALAQLRVKNPELDIRQLIIPIKAVRALDDEILWDAYDRLHGRGTFDGIQAPRILYDLLRALQGSSDLGLALV